MHLTDEQLTADVLEIFFYKMGDAIVSHRMVVLSTMNTT